MMPTDQPYGLAIHTLQIQLLPSSNIRPDFPGEIPGPKQAGGTAPMLPTLAFARTLP